MDYHNRIDWNKQKEERRNNSLGKINDEINSIDENISGLVITEDTVYEYDIECLKKNRKYE